MSYIFQDHETFWSASRDVIYDKRTPSPSFDKDRLDATGLPYLPTLLLGIVLKAQVALMNFLANYVLNQLDSVERKR